MKNKYILHNPFNGFRIHFERTNRVYLLQDELQRLHEVKLNNSLCKMRNVFLFACYTGLSYTDISKLSKKNLKKGNDDLMWIYIKRNKTNIPSNIPLLPPAVLLIKKFEKLYNGKTLFPIISNQKINKGLKRISALCGFNKKLTFHSARHTFATTVTLTNGVPIETVSKMLGHNNIKTTQIYARVIDSKVSQDMLILRQKFI
ncbi:MAG: integrase catalytic domain-containing protein [Pelagibacterales bacterium]|nr:integrase catalytic domain-containing protein [Pelagibacterales bacterium]